VGRYQLPNNQIDGIGEYSNTTHYWYGLGLPKDFSENFFYDIQYLAFTSVPSILNFIP
jgi:hypothetical protein